MSSKIILDTYSERCEFQHLHENWRIVTAPFLLAVEFGKPTLKPPKN